MTAKEYAKELKEQYYYVREALNFADKRVQESDPRQWDSLPVGAMFYDEYDARKHRNAPYIKTVSHKTKDNKTETRKFVLRHKELLATHNFWVEVKGRLKNNAY